MFRNRFLSRSFSKMNKESVERQLDSLMVFLDEHFALVNCHIVDYFTKNLYDTCVPRVIRQEIPNNGFPKIIADILGNNLLNNTPNLREFVNKSKFNSLYNICVSHKEFQQKLVELTKNESYFNSIKLKVFVTEKKSHEIQLMSNICAALSELAGTTHVVDLGDGKGYLSSVLALYYKLKVLGIEGCEIKTEGAVKRVQKLQRVWHCLPKSPNKSTAPINARQNSVISDYKQITRFVTEDSDIKQLVIDVFLEEPIKIGLVGLHTCGNLSPTSLKIYASSDALKTICNVGCCYHLMNEHFEDCNFNKNTSKSFPMSDYLNAKKFSLGREARMLAAQTIDRMFSEKNLPTKTTFFRAILQVLLGGQCEGQTIGRLKKECATFEEYTKIASTRLALDFNKSDVDEVYLKFASRFDELNAFYVLRSMLAPTVESIILLDRLLFLLERGYNNSYLVNLFDPVISPRCYAIVSFK